MLLDAQSCPTLCSPMDCSPPGSSVHGDSPAKHTRVGSLSLLQGIFPTQESNRGLLHCRQGLLHLLHWRVGSLPLALARLLLSVLNCPSLRSVGGRVHPPLRSFKTQSPSPAFQVHPLLSRTWAGAIIGRSVYM